MLSTNQSNAATRFNRTDGGRAPISKQAVVGVVAASGNGRAVGSISRRRHRQRASHHAVISGTLLRQNCARFASHAEGCWPLRRHEKVNSSCCGTDTRSAVQRFLVVRLRDAAAPARFFTPPVDFGREPEGFFAPPLNAFFPPDAADFLAMAGDSFFAAVLDRVFVFVPRVFVLDADRFFAVDAPFRERAVAVRLRASAAARRLEASSPGSAGVSPLEPLVCRALAADGALGNVDGSAGEVPAGTAWRISNRSRTTLCANFCLLRAWRISSPCRSRPATL